MLNLYHGSGIGLATTWGVALGATAVCEWVGWALTLFTSSVQFYYCCQDCWSCYCYCFDFPSSFPHNECCYHYKPFFPFGLKSPLSNKQASMHSNLPSKSWLGPTFQITIAIMIGSFSLGQSTIFTADSFHLYYELDRSFLCVYISSLLQFHSIDHNKIKLFDWRKHHQCRPKVLLLDSPRLQGHVVVFYGQVGCV